MRIGVLLLALLAPMAARAQEAEKAGWLDAPRLMRPQARLAIEARDWEAAWRLNAAGRALQPGHTGLIRQAVGIADAAGDAGRLMEALDALAGAGSSVNIDKLDSAKSLPTAELDAIRKRFAANEAAVGEAEIAVEVALPDALIESVAVDPGNGDLYLGSVMERTIYRTSSDEPRTARVFADKEAGLFSVFGMIVDGPARRLYAATGTVPQTPLQEGEAGGTAILVFDLENGSVHKRLTAGGAKQIADLTLADGVIYATDSQAPRIYRHRMGRDELTVFSSDPRFVSLQGIAPLGKDLIVADYAVGLWRIDRHTGKATMVRPPADGESLIGIDGLTAGPERTLYAVRNGTPPHAVLRLTFSDSGKLLRVEPELRGHHLFDEPTLMSVSGGTAYLVARSQWPLFPADGSMPKRPRANPVILKWIPGNGR